MTAQAEHRPSVGVIGLGIMGGLYARHLVEAGYTVFGYDVDADRMAAFSEAGGEPEGSPASVIAQADIVLTSLSSIDAFKAVLIDPSGPVGQAREGQLFIETGTIPIEMKEAARDHLRTHGAEMIDTPVTGTRLHAETKDLVVYLSGEEAACERARPVIEAWARDVRYVGPFGAGMKLKIVTNLLVAVHNVAAAEALALAKVAELDLRIVYDLINSGAATSKAFGFRGLMMLEDRTADATMRMDVFSKDLAIIGAFAGSVHAETPLFDSSAELYQRALDQGIRTKDIAAVFDLLSHPDGAASAAMPTKELT